MAASGLAGFISWLGIAVCHYRFRKAYIYQGMDLNKLKYKAKLFPLGPILAFILCIVVVLGQGLRYLQQETIDISGLIAAYIGIPIFIVLWMVYKVKHKTKIVSLEDVDLNTNHK